MVELFDEQYGQLNSMSRTETAATESSTGDYTMLNGLETAPFGSLPLFCNSSLCPDIQFAQISPLK